jgi:transcriptional regulator with XRE-family HTH domain
MTRINPDRLRHYRAKQNLSQADLGERSGIDKGTIHRIEAGKTRRNNTNVVSSLAHALKVEPSLLTAVDMEGIEPPTTEFFEKTQLNVRVSPEIRNALSMVSRRYSVTPTEVIEFAPLLFHLVASESLKERAARLDRLRDARARVTALDGLFKHITNRILKDWDAEQLDDMEARSIAKRDLRGDVLDDDDSIWDRRPHDYDADEQNPFITHLKDRLSAAQADADDTLDGWNCRAGVCYQICREQALEWFGGDHDAADDFVRGSYSISEMPREIRTAEAPERVAWAVQKRIEVGERVNAWFASMGLELPQ